jgi:hypothetical protein
MATENLAADSVHANPYESGPFRLVSDMENTVRIIRDLMTGLCRMADSFEDDGEAIAVVAELARDKCAELEKSRGELCRLTHPRRAEFDKEGWPADRVRGLEDGEARPRVVLSKWGEALLSMKCTEGMMEAAGEDQAEIDRAAEAQLNAVVELLTVPAPNAAGLAHKLEVLGKHKAAWGFDATPAIVEALAADARRFAAPGWGEAQ